MDRYMKVVFTVIAIALASIAVKDLNVFEVAEAQWQASLGNASAGEHDMLTLQQGFGVALEASAGPGFICSSRLYMHEYETGDYGHVLLRFNTRKHCGGDDLGLGAIYSEGSTNSPLDTTYLYSEAGIMSVYETASNAAALGQEVYYFKCDNVPNPGALCLKYISFKGVPVIEVDTD